MPLVNSFKKKPVSTVDGNQKSGDDLQLRLVVYPIIYRVL